MTKILIDFHQTVISSVAMNAKDFKGESREEIFNMIKHTVFGMMLKWKQKFKGELIVCTDGKIYWRTAILKSYKGHRKHDKEKDTLLDWDLIHDAIEDAKKDIKEHFNIKVIEVNGAEADDVIACLVKYFQTNECQDGVRLEPLPQDIIIISTDGDLQQLQKYKNVRQWDNVNSRFIEADNPEHVLIEHICTGDTDDNVPNILTGDEWANIRAKGEKPPRQKAFMAKKRLPAFFENGIDACESKEERDNFERNEMLVSLDKIPETINRFVVKAYTNYEVNGSLIKMRNYFAMHRMKRPLENLQDWR